MEVDVPLIVSTLHETKKHRKEKRKRPVEDEGNVPSQLEVDDRPKKKKKKKSRRPEAEVIKEAPPLLTTPVVDLVENHVEKLDGEGKKKKKRKRKKDKLSLGDVATDPTLATDKASPSHAGMETAQGAPSSDAVSPELDLADLALRCDDPAELMRAITKKSKHDRKKKRQEAQIHDDAPPPPIPSTSKTAKPPRAIVPKPSTSSKTAAAARVASTSSTDSHAHILATQWLNSKQLAEMVEQEGLLVILMYGLVVVLMPDHRPRIQKGEIL